LSLIKKLIKCDYAVTGIAQH